MRSTLIHDEKQLGLIGVDSGCVAIGDPCYIVPDADDTPITWEQAVARMFEDRSPVPGIDNTGVVEIEGLFFSSTPHGDGSYPVIGLFNNRGELAGLRVEFESTFRTRKVRLGEAPVDSGTIMVGDPCYMIEGGGNDKILQWPQVVDAFYDGDHEAESLEGGARKISGVIMSNTVCGDGSYPVWALVGDTEGGRDVVLGLEIDFSGESEEEICNMCGSDNLDWAGTCLSCEEEENACEECGDQLDSSGECPVCDADDEDEDEDEDD